VYTASGIVTLYKWTWWLRSTQVVCTAQRLLRWVEEK